MQIARKDKQVNSQLEEHEASWWEEAPPGLIQDSFIFVVFSLQCSLIFPVLFGKNQEEKMIYHETSCQSSATASRDSQSVC